MAGFIYNCRINKKRIYIFTPHRSWSNNNFVMDKERKLEEERKSSHMDTL